MADDRTRMPTIEAYRDRLIAADLIDDRYDVSGEYVWLPEGLELRRRFFDDLRQSSVTQGYREYEFPHLVPEANLEPQKEAATSFEDAVCWVTRFGDEELSEPYYLRPTGETQIYPIVSRWIRSYRDLPMKILTVQPMFRAVKGGDPLLSGQGEFMAEGHEFFRTAERARTSVERLIDEIDGYLSALGLDPLVVDRPIWGNHPVAERTIGFDVQLRDRTMMAASLYLQGERYAHAYDITYRDESNEATPVSQVSWGIAARVLGLHLLASSDDRGFRPRTDLSPVQIAFIPIQNEADAKSYSEQIASQLDVRTAIDDSHRELWEKFELWETRGVPLRVEVGPDEIESETLTVFRRDANERVTIPATATKLRDLLDSIDFSWERSPTVSHVDSLDVLSGIIENHEIGRLYFCGSETCGREIESEAPGEILGTDVQSSATGPCLNCGETGELAYYSRRH